MSSVKIQPILERFKLTYPSRKRLRTKEPKFGFNGLGEVVFRRTYSRDNESWNDVVIRVIEGTMSIRKEHFIRNSLHWNDVEWQSFAHSMAKSLFDMEWMPPGRGLWMMGTDFTYTRGSTALNNCGATDTVYDIVHSAEWTMDLLMNGVGIGFSTNWRGTATAPDKSNPEIYVIPDSREGWVESLIKLMCSYIDSPRHGHNKYQQFDYSTIRAPGVKIKGFGGTSSGLEPLKKMHIRIESYLDAFCQGKLECKAKTWQEIKNTTPSETPSETHDSVVSVSLYSFSDLSRSPSRSPSRSSSRSAFRRIFRRSIRLILHRYFVNGENNGLNKLTQKILFIIFTIEYIVIIV